MPLTLTTPITPATITAYVITTVTWDVENDSVAIQYTRKAGSTAVDSLIATMPSANITSASGATMKLKIYNALATALGTPGTAS
jgi:hypothetical protein